MDVLYSSYRTEFTLLDVTKEQLQELARFTGRLELSWVKDKEDSAIGSDLLILKWFGTLAKLMGRLHSSTVKT